MEVKSETQRLYNFLIDIEHYGQSLTVREGWTARFTKLGVGIIKITGQE